MYLEINPYRLTKQFYMPFGVLDICVTSQRKKSKLEILTFVQIL